MNFPCSIQVRFIYFTVFVWITFTPYAVSDTATASCQVYPSEYAYHYNSVSRSENRNADCRRYPVDHDNVGVDEEQYTHCDGRPLQLANDNYGQDQYGYYSWSASTSRSGGSKLLFIFPTRVSLTTITLHYHSDNRRGLSRLRFYVVSDDFDIWDTASPSYSHADVASVPPGGEPAGRRNTSINVNFNTKKVLMYKFSSSFIFAVSEVEFFTCEDITTLAWPDYKVTTTSNLGTTYIPTSSAQINRDAFSEGVTTEIEVFATTSFTKPVSITTSFIAGKRVSIIPSNGITAIGVSIAILLILSISLIIAVVLLIWSYKRRSAKQNHYTDSSYSTLRRGSGQQIQPWSVQDSAQLYDHIQLSPSTGQTEFIPKSESTNINNSSTTLQNSHPTYSTTGNDRVKYSLALNAANQGTTSQKTHEISCEQPTCAAIDKSKKNIFKKQMKEESKHKVAKKGSPVSPYRHEIPSVSLYKEKEKAEEQEICPSHAVEELYTAVEKKPKGSQPKDKEETPPIFPHTVEELYTAVEKKPKSIPDENKVEAPTHTVLQNTTEDLYTTVMKKPKDGPTEVAPPLPPHTVEGLYTAVMKKPKESKEDEEEAPPIPPYTVEEN